jgi:integrase
MVMSLLRRRLKPHSEKDIAELRGSDYVAVIEKLERAMMPGAADEFRTRCRAFLSWCHVEAKVIDHNPLFGYRRQKATRADRLAKVQHGRALSDPELVAVWRAADPAKVFGRYVRFLILTGCRRGEGAGLSRSMMTGDGQALDLPAIFVKQGRGHVVCVSPALADLLALCEVDSRSDLFFPSHRTGGPMSGWNKHTAGLVNASGVAFTFHDLRRTFRTGLSRLGVDTETAELALGHARANLQSIYNRNEGRDELRKAFGLWSEHVMKITSGYGHIVRTPLNPFD